MVVWILSVKKVWVLTFLKLVSVTITNRNNSKIYEMINTINESKIIDKHTRLLNRYILCVNDENKYLPYIFWPPEMCKSLTKSRFLLAHLSAPENYFLNPLILPSITFSTRLKVTKVSRNIFQVVSTLLRQLLRII